MKRSIVLLLAAALLLCACGPAAPSGSSSSLPSPSSQVQASSMPSVQSQPPQARPPAQRQPSPNNPFGAPELEAHHRDAEPWQLAYYDICRELGLTRNPDSRIELLYSGKGTPILGLRYQKGGVQYSRCWLYTGEKAELIYDSSTFEQEHDFYSRFYISRVTGNPVIYKKAHTNDYSQWFIYWYEIVDGRAVPLSLPTDFFSIAQVTLVYGDVIAPSRTGHPAALLFDSYQPALPEDAPAWVGEYLKYLYANDWYGYNPDDTMKNEHIKPLTILPPMYEGGAPVLMGQSFYTFKPGDTSYRFLCNGEVTPLVAGYPMGGAPGSSFYLDEAGRGVYRFGIYDQGGGSIWYSISRYGFTKLFEEGWGVDDNGRYAFFDGETYYGGETEEWLEQKRAAAFARLGYAGTLQELDSIYNAELYYGEEEVERLYALGCRYYTFEGVVTWAEYESALVKALCNYAAEML